MNEYFDFISTKFASKFSKETLSDTRLLKNLSKILKISQLWSWCLKMRTSKASLSSLATVTVGLSYQPGVRGRCVSTWSLLSLSLESSRKRLKIEGFHHKKGKGKKNAKQNA